MPTKNVPIKDVCITGGTQQRPVDDGVMRRYSARMADGVKFPPVSIITDGKSNFLADGFHRLMAAKKLNKKYIEANITHGTQRDAIKASFGANKTNAFPRQEGTVKNILEKICKDDEWGKASLTDIAKHVGCARVYASKCFAEFRKAAEDSKQKNEGLFPPGTADVRAPKAEVKRGGKKYEQKIPAKKVLDSKGKQVPGHLIKYFERANEYRVMIRQLNDMLKEVRDGKNEGDLFYRYIKIENLTAEIGNVKRIFRFALPFAVCPYCGGDENNSDCRACEGCGFVNEMTWKTTPEDLR